MAVAGWGLALWSAALRRHLSELKALGPEALVRDRYQKYRAIGVFTEAGG